MESHICNHFHPFLEFLDIVNNLGLYEIGAGSNLLGKSDCTEFKGGSAKGFSAAPIKNLGSDAFNSYQTEISFHP